MFTYHIPREYICIYSKIYNQKKNQWNEKSDFRIYNLNTYISIRDLNKILGRKIDQIITLHK